MSETHFEFPTPLLPIPRHDGGTYVFLLRPRQEQNAPIHRQHRKTVLLAVHRDRVPDGRHRFSQHSVPAPHGHMTVGVDADRCLRQAGNRDDIAQILHAARFAPGIAGNQNPSVGGHSSRVELTAGDHDHVLPVPDGTLSPAVVTGRHAMTVRQHCRRMAYTAGNIHHVMPRRSVAPTVRRCTDCKHAPVSPQGDRM